MKWQYKHFNELSLNELYELLRLRQDVFIIEQECFYPDIDGEDQAAGHLFLRRHDDQRIVAYLRIFAPGVKYQEATIGRVIIEKTQRGKELGAVLMREGIRVIQAEYPNSGIKISAQEQLETFYNSLGFNRSSQPYDEDGIMHIDMVLV